ncbi:hypothetical protein VNO77_19952 [Canavalia gladiata]|uniref:Uncharacterized protein n=1 Tax=Canavalia gladiata TaxID=3824 RepID=A0AAN9LRV3_CANGL
MLNKEINIKEEKLWAPGGEDLLSKIVEVAGFCDSSGKEHVNLSCKSSGKRQGRDYRYFIMLLSSIHAMSSHDGTTSMARGAYCILQIWVGKHLNYIRHTKIIIMGATDSGAIISPMVMSKRIRLWSIVIPRVQLSFDLLRNNPWWLSHARRMNVSQGTSWVCEKLEESERSDL